MVKGGVVETAGVIENQESTGSEIGVGVAAVVDLKGGVVHADFDHTSVNIQDAGGPTASAVSQNTRTGDQHAAVLKRTALNTKLAAEP